LAQAETHDALIELEAAGVVMRPGQQPPNRNTKLAIVARNALKPILGDDQVAEIERQVDAGKLSLADLNALAEKGKDISTGILALIFGTANPQEVAMAFLHDQRHDAEIEKKAAHKELRRLLEISFDVELPASAGLTNLRERLARHVLLTDLMASLGSKKPVSLSSVKLATSPGGVDSSIRLARSWRNDREFRTSYVDFANRVEQEFKLGQCLEQQFTAAENRSNQEGFKEAGHRFAPALAGINENETFLAVERLLMREVENELVEAPRPNLVRLAAARMSRFWAEVEPAAQARWALIASAGEVLVEADRVENEIKSAANTVSGLVKAYAEDKQPWCLLDRHHRHMETRKYSFEFAAGGEHQGLDKLIARAEQRYMEVGSALAKQFISTFEKASQPIKGVLRQQDLFDMQVKSRFGSGKVAYLWVDALRFEMARELCEVLKDEFDLTIQPAIGAIPTITEIGMAALLPKTGGLPRVVSAGGGKLAVELGGRIIKDRKDRVAFLKENAGLTVFDCKLDDLLPKPGKKTRDGIHGADLVLVTSQEIDELCEGDNIAQARLQMDGILGHLRRGIRILSENGVKSLVLAADHGHLFADEIGEGMKIEAPGGKTEDLHRRVWIGVGGTSEPSYLRTSLSSLGTESEFDIATPWTFACFKSKGGARAYFHGGLSPQELIIPVILLKPIQKAGTPRGGVEWTLTPGASKLTTRFFSVQIAGAQTERSLFGFEPPKVRIEVRANKKCISVPVSASYGFEDATGEVKLKAAEQDPTRIEPNTVAVMIEEEVTQKTVGIHLVDASTGAELSAPLTIDAAISI
jgi:hypothetical protein